MRERSQRVEHLGGQAFTLLNEHGTAERLRLFFVKNENSKKLENDLKCLMKNVIWMHI